MSTASPLFHSPDPTEGYIPREVPHDQLEAIKDEMRSKQIQVTPDNIRHSLESEEIRVLLRSMGIDTTKRVSATRDLTGMIKLTFDQFRTVVERVQAMTRAEATS